MLHWGSLALCFFLLFLLLVFLPFFLGIPGFDFGFAVACGVGCMLITSLHAMAKVFPHVRACV